MDFVSGFLTAVLVAGLGIWVPLLCRRSFDREGWGIWVGAVAVFSLCFPPGTSPAVAHGWPWVLFAIWGSYRSCRTAVLWGHDHFGHSLSAAASILLVGGSIWFCAARFSSLFLEFGEPWKTLTAIHFHYAGYLFLAATALHWDAVARFGAAVRNSFKVASLLYVLGFAAVAAGLNGTPGADQLGVPLMILSGEFLLGMVIGGKWKHMDRIARCCGVLALVSGTISYLLAFGYLLRIPSLLSLPAMVETHGAINAFVFIPAWVLFALRTTEPLPVRAIPFSRLRARWKVGREFFVPFQVPGENKTGLVDHFDVFARRDFDPKQVHPEIRRFYEHTIDYSLHVSADPSPWFRRVWKYLARPLFAMVQQLDLPDSEKDIEGTIEPIRPDVDGRSDPRAWMRVDRKDQRPIYAAAYAVHRTDRVTYMNIAFPLPSSNMTSILYPQHSSLHEAGVCLTTLRVEDPRACDQGVYSVTRFGTARLALDETIEVWFENELRARHTLWFSGLRYLTLEYKMARTA